MLKLARARTLASLALKQMDVVGVPQFNNVWTVPLMDLPMEHVLEMLGNINPALNAPNTLTAKHAYCTALIAFSATTPKAANQSVLLDALELKAALVNNTTLAMIALLKLAVVIAPEAKLVSPFKMDAQPTEDPLTLVLAIALPSLIAELV